jgi:hypothetical protein
MRYLILIILLTACGARTEPVDHPSKPIVVAQPIVTAVSFHRYAISESEHMVIIDIPDKFVPRRCAVYVNELTKTSSSLNCNFDETSSPMPEQE